MATPEPAAARSEKALRLLAAGAVTRTRSGYDVRGDSGATYALEWHRKRERWLCPCPSRGYPCKHVLAVEEYVRRERATREAEVEKEQPKMAAQDKQTAMVHHQPTMRALATSYPSPHELSCQKEFAQMLIDSRLVPQGMDVPKVILTLEMGRELGMPPLVAMNNCYVVNQKVTLMNNGAVALVQQSGNLAGMRIEEDKDACTVWTKRRDNGQEYTNTWTMADAARAGLQTNQNWRKYPKQMLRARAIFENLRVNFADVLMGMYSPEEIGAVVEIDDQGRETVQQASAEAPPAAAPAHDTDTGEILDAEFEPEPAEEPPPPDDAPPLDPKADTEDPWAEENAAAAAEIAAEWHWPSTPEASTRAVLAKLGYTPEAADAEIAAVTNDIMLRALVARLKGELAAQQAKLEQGIDFDGDAGAGGGRRLDAPGDAQVPPPAAPDAAAMPGDNDLTPLPTEQLEAWESILATAEATVAGDTVPEDLAGKITRKEEFRKHMMAEHGYGFGEQEVLCRQLGMVGDPGKLTKGQRLGLIWWSETYPREGGAA